MQATALQHFTAISVGKGIQKGGMMKRSYTCGKTMEL